jgi:hypothetical protein
MQWTAYRTPVRRVRRWVGDIERLEDRLVLSSAAGNAIVNTNPAVFLNHAGKVSKGHVVTYPFVVSAASYITVDVSNLPHADKVSLEAGDATLRTQTGGAYFTTTLQPGTYTIAIKGNKKAKFDVTLSYRFVNPPTPPPSNPTPAPPPTPTMTPSPTKPKIDVDQFANALISADNQAAHQFAVDASTVEILAPTLGYKSIDPELAQVDTDSTNGNIFHGYQDMLTLGKTMWAEADVTVAAGLPDPDALLGYSKIVTDLEQIGTLKEITYAFIDYLASKLSTPFTGTTPQYLTTGALGNGNSNGIVSPTTQPAITTYYSGDLPKLNNYFGSYLTGPLDPNNQLSAATANYNPSTSVDSATQAGNGYFTSGTIGDIAGAATGDSDAGNDYSFDG